MALVTPTDRPKSVRSPCLIELFCGVVCVVTLPFWHFCWCRGFCHRTESDLFLFLLTSLQKDDRPTTDGYLDRQGIPPCVGVLFIINISTFYSKKPLKRVWPNCNLTLNVANVRQNVDDRRPDRHNQSVAELFYNPAKNSAIKRTHISYIANYPLQTFI